MSRESKASTGRPGYVGVNLLPEEIKLAENAATQRRLTVLLTILVFVVVGAATLGAAYLANAAAGNLATAQARAEEILVEQQAFGGGQKVAGQITATKSAQQFTTIAEIDLADLIGDVLAATPASITITGIDFEAQTAVTDGQLPSGPLEAPRVASMVLTGVTGSQTDVKAWVDGLAKLEGFGGAPVQQLQGGNQWSVVLFLSAERWTARYGGEGQSPDTSTQPDPTSDPTPTEAPTPTPTPTPTESEG